MTELAVNGFRAEHEAILEIAKSLSADEWNSPSDCAGWATRDVLGHMASTLHGVVDPAFMPDMSGGTEQSMEAPVKSRRALPIEEVDRGVRDVQRRRRRRVRVGASRTDGRCAVADGRTRHAHVFDAAEHVLVRRVHAPPRRHVATRRLDRSSRAAARRATPAADRRLDDRGTAVDVHRRARHRGATSDHARTHRTRRWNVDVRARRSRRSPRDRNRHRRRTRPRRSRRPITTSSSGERNAGRGRTACRSRATPRPRPRSSTRSTSSERY